MVGNYIGNNPNKANVLISDDYETNSSTLFASTKCVYNAVQEILSQMLTGDPWSLFPPKIPVVVDGVTFGGSDGRRAIMPGENTAREDWILCDGGSDGKGGTVPDLRGRVILGASDSHAAGSTGGSETHTHSISGTVGSTTLSVAQMPSHTHTWSRIGDDGNGRGMDASIISYNDPGWLNDNPLNTSGSSRSHTHTLDGSSGEATSLPPYYALSYIMRTA